MSRRFFLVPTVAILLVGWAEGSGPVPRDLRVVDDYADLQGTWELQEMVTNGGKTKITGNYWIVQRDRLTLKGLGRQEEMRITVDVRRRPSSISFSKNRMGCYDSIYRIEGNTLQVCMSVNAPRPKSFDMKAAGNVFLFTYKKVTRAPTPPPANRDMS
jgi:uncharacterized protein (TIGR03067 family)